MFSLPPPCHFAPFCQRAFNIYNRVGLLNPVCKRYSLRILSSNPPTINIYAELDFTKCCPCVLDHLFKRKFAFRPLYNLYTGSGKNQLDVGLLNYANSFFYDKQDRKRLIYKLLRSYELLRINIIEKNKINLKNVYNFFFFNF